MFAVLFLLYNFYIVNFNYKSYLLTLKRKNTYILIETVFRQSFYINYLNATVKNTDVNT